ncbi:serine hydrolase [Ideonella sp.]|uniref:serine hydrolase domain-containing protein n=2 Tax=Ideonella sp. TaxID=1929293 RepID=UPI00351B1ADA
MPAMPPMTLPRLSAALWSAVFAIGASPVWAADDVAAKVAAVENGLRPPVSFEGDKPWSLAERMRHYGVPGVTLTVVNNGSIAWTRTYGLADREAGTPMTASTLLLAGSVSKPVAAYGALRMVQAGELNLQQPVNARLKSWQIPANEFTDKVPVTLAHLLSHTGGLTVHGFNGYTAGTPFPDTVAILNGAAPANSAPVRVDLLPGSAWRYSGGGYTVAQLLMADVAQQSFPVLMQQRVLGPLGMVDSSFSNPLPPAQLPRAAAGVLPDGSALTGKRNTYPEMAAAGLWTTSQDLARFLIEIQQALKGQSPRLSAALAQDMLTPRLGSGYGLGLGMPDFDGQKYFAHGGWDEGFCTMLIGSQTSGQGVVVMINANQPALMSELQQAVAFAYGWPGVKDRAALPTSAQALASAPGRYRVNGEQVAVVTRDGDRLQLGLAGLPSSELVTIGANRYLQREQPRERSFELGADGVQALLQHGPEGKTERLPRLRDGERLPRELLLAGEYEAALKAYQALRDAKDDAGKESYLNEVGMNLVTQRQVDTGLAVLKINTELYPNAANTWDSLGAAYLAQGNKAMARESYQHALRIDPVFPSAKEALLHLAD